MKELVLASQSPRRKELLEQLGRPFVICPAVGEEVMDGNLSPSALVESLSLQKAEEVLKKHPDSIVIGADTIVVLGEMVFGKPKSVSEAEKMIGLLQGNTHCIYTGVSVATSEKIKTFHQRSKLTMRALTPKQVSDYVSQGESLDKAGGYGIQGLGAWLTESIQGDFYNIMGLPLCQLGKVLPEFGIELFGSEGNP